MKLAGSYEAINTIVMTGGLRTNHRAHGFFCQIFQLALRRHRARGWLW